MTKKLRTLVVGCGNMGRSHARAYHKIDGFEIVGVVNRSKENSDKLFEKIGPQPLFNDYASALKELNPDVVSVNTWPGTHAEYAIMAMEAGAHVFLEKPIAENLIDGEKVIETANRTGKKLVLGYILNHHPSWKKFVEIGRSLGTPLVMRMNLNQQSTGTMWETHKHLMESISPIVDCGVHYVDVMCQLTGSTPVRVNAIGARLSSEIKPDMYNYGQLQVTFEDGSVGWYEAGWGPMMSQNAYFVKDVIGPKGSVSMIKKDGEGLEGKSSDIDGHTETNSLLWHKFNEGLENGEALKDEWIDMQEEPKHQKLCDLEQEFFIKAIREDMDLTQHHQSALNSLRIVLAADESFRTGNTVNLESLVAAKS